MAETTNAAAAPNLGSAFELLGKSLEVVKRNWKMFVVVNIFTILGSLSAITPNQKADEYATPTNPPFDFEWVNDGGKLLTVLAIALVLILVMMFVYAMMTSLELRSTSGETPTFSTLFADAKKYWLRLFGLSIVCGLILIVGFLLLIVPGIIAIGRLIMSPYLLLDKDLGVMEAIRQSNEMGKKYPGKVWAAIGVTIVVQILAAVVGIIPILGAIIGTGIVIAYSLVGVLRYQQLKKLGPKTAKSTLQAPIA